MTLIEKEIRYRQLMDRFRSYLIKKYPELRMSIHLSSSADNPVLIFSINDIHYVTNYHDREVMAYYSMRISRYYNVEMKQIEFWNLVTSHTVQLFNCDRLKEQYISNRVYQR